MNQYLQLMTVYWLFHSILFALICCHQRVLSKEIYEFL